MKVVFFIHTSGQTYLWKNVARILEYKGHEILFIARNNESVYTILDECNIKYLTYGAMCKTSFGKILQFPFQLLRLFSPTHNFKPDIVIGFGPMETFMGMLLRKPSIIFDDNELRSLFDRLSWQFTASVIITPSCYEKDLGERHVRCNGYKELAYLHPNYFSPDTSIFTDLGITNREQFVILRFGSFVAIHDIKRKGFSLKDKYLLVDKLSKVARVFISAEGTLPTDLMQYKLPTSYHKIHQVLYFADLLIGDTGTMAWEASVLGTPSIVCASFTPYLGNFIELEHNYGLLYCLQEVDKAIDKAIDLIKQPYLKETWGIKRSRLLKEKIDIAQFFADFIEIYLGHLT